MGAQEDEFVQRLRATFKVEADEHVQAMSSGLLKLEATPETEGNAEHLESIFRHAHSLKGAARAANFNQVEAICQSLETVFAAWKRLEINPLPEEYDALHRAVDLMGNLILVDDKERPREERAKISAVIQELAQIKSREQEGQAEPESANSQEQSGIEASPVSLSPNVDSSFRESRQTGSEPLTPTGTIRITTAKLDKLLRQTEEMLTVKQIAAEHTAGLRQLAGQFELWTREWTKAQGLVRELRHAQVSPQTSTIYAHGVERSAPPDGGMQANSLHSGLSEFLDWNLEYIRSLEVKLRTLIKSATQDQHAVGKLAEDLLADSKQLIMLQFSTLSDLMPKLVRDLSRDQAKDIELVVRGSDVEMDKRILEAMKDPLIHLVRNCIDHGIEKPAYRLQHGKPARAVITLEASRVNGNNVEILVSDDGVGIDPVKVKEAALKRGSISAEEARQLDDQRALELIFQSEVSTSPIITEISGRGLGLAIVREQTEKLGGLVSFETHLNTGTTFRIVLPSILATFRGILTRVAKQVFIIPTANVERVARIKSGEIKTVENRETVLIDARVISFARLQDVLEIADNARGKQTSDYISLLILALGDERIAFGVDEVLHDEEVLVRSLTKPLSRVRNIAGATVLASGTVIPVLNVADLMKSARNSSIMSRPAVAGTVAAKAAPIRKRLLLAEDSITSRMLLKTILESAGYEVRTAVDGMEAFGALRTEDFDLVVSDIEMPRMNGFELTAQIRRDKKLADKPVVLVTALSSQADRERGIDAGANAYIIKSSFDQSNLLDTVKRLII